MAYEAALIRSATNNVIKVAHPAVPDSPVTYLAASTVATDTALTVLDNNGFADNDFVVIGEFGFDKTEIKQIGAAVTAGLSLTVSATTYDHPVDTPVSFIPWNEVEISGAATVGGSKTVITTIGLQVDRAETVYVNTGTTYAYYFARYKNTETSTFSAYSDAADATGYSTSTIRAVKDEALSMANTRVSNIITDEFLNREIFNCEQEVWFEKKRWSWANTFNYIAGNTTEGDYSLTLPSDITDPNTNTSLIHVHIGDRPELGYITKEEWDRRQELISHTTLATTFNTGAVSIVLTDSSDFDDTGSILIGANSYTYTANDKSTGTLTVTATAQGETAGVDVWQNAAFGEPTAFTVFNGVLYFDRPPDSSYAGLNIYLDYYRKPTAINSDSDTLNIPDWSVYHYYLAWKILLRKNNGIPDNSTELMRNLYEQRKLILKRKDRLGQRTLWRPRINNMRVTNRSDIIATNPQA